VLFFFFIDCLCLQTPTLRASTLQGQNQKISSFPFLLGAIFVGIVAALLDSNFFFKISTRRTALGLHTTFACSIFGPPLCDSLYMWVCWYVYLYVCVWKSETSV